MSMYPIKEEIPEPHVHYVIRKDGPWLRTTAALKMAFDRHMPRGKIVVISPKTGTMKSLLGVHYRSVVRVVKTHGFVWMLPNFISTPLTTLCMTHQVTKQLKQFKPAAVNYSVRNFCGYMGTAHVLWVGEEINPVYKNLKHWPFYANRGCAVFLNRWLDQLNYDEDVGVWTNARHDTQHFLHELVHAENIKHVIALGTVAADAVRKADGEDKLRPFYHPQYVKRFMNKSDHYEALRHFIDPLNS